MSSSLQLPDLLLQWGESLSSTSGAPKVGSEDTALLVDSEVAGNKDWSDDLNREMNKRVITNIFTI